MVKRVSRACVEGNREKGKPQRRCMDGVRILLIERGLSEGEGGLLARAS